MKKDLRGMIGNQLTLNSPPPLFLIKFMVYLLMTPMFSIFTLAIKFGYLFLVIFQSFHVIVSFIFDKLAPPRTYVSKDVLNHYFNPFQCIKQSQKS